VTEMHLQKPVVPFVLLHIPVPEQLIHIFLFLHQVLTQLSLLHLRRAHALRVALRQLV
jgi:hypothetical protein